MMKIFRWQGLVAFLIVGGLLWGFLTLFLDGMIERAIEEDGSRAAETEIGLSGLSTSILAQALNLDGLRVANPDDPAKNIVEASAVSVNVDAVKGLQRKVVIDDMSVLGLRFNTARPSPAKSYKKAAREKSPEEEAGAPAKGEEGGGLSVLDRVDIKSPAEILKNEPLETLAAAKRAEEELARLQAKWQELLQREMDPAVLKQTERRIQELTDKAAKLSDLSELPAITQEFQSLKSEVQDQINKVPHLKEELNKDLAHARQLVAELKDLPRKDYERLKKKYSLDLSGGGNLVGALIGGKVKAELDRAVKYYRMLSPYLNRGGKKPKEEEVQYERGKGVFVKFEEAEPFPDFLLRHAKLSMTLLDTPIEGVLADLSDNQKAYGKPAALDFSSGKTDRFDSFSLKTRLDRTRARFEDSLDLAASGVRLRNVAFDEGVELKEGAANLSGSLKIIAENEIAGRARADFSALVLSLPRKEGNALWNAVVDALQSVDRFHVALDVKGTLDAVQVEVDSDLDGILRKALEKAVSGQLKEFEGALRQAIDAQAKGALGGVGGELGDLNDLSKLLSANESSWKDLLVKAQGGLGPAKKKLPGGLGDLKLPF